MATLDRRNFIKLAGAAAGSAALVGCGGNSAAEAPAGSAAADDGSAAAAATDAAFLDLTVEPGKLTVATGNPAWTPWVMDDAPESGEGFEAALIYKLAAQLGVADEDVVWVRTDFGEAFAPGPKDWDINIQQVSINADRAEAVDFSPAYFRTTQSIAVAQDSPYASATALADFADATLAVMVGSTAYDFVKDLIKGGSEDGIDVFDDNSDAAAAVSNGQADGIVTDTTEIVYMVESEQVANGVVVGQIPGSEDEFGLGMTLAKDSPLTPYVTDALNALLDDGTVDALITEWLAAYTTDIPTLTA